MTCPLCGAEQQRLRYPATSAAGAADPGTFRCTSDDLARHPDIVQCLGCSLLFNDPQPDPALLRQLYSQVEDQSYLSESGGRERTFARSLAQLHSLPHQLSRPPGRLLDIGCYTGVFMGVAAEAGWQVEGVELSSWAATIARDRGLGVVYSQPVEQLDLAAGSFDVITLWDVVEHLGDPLAMLRVVQRLLKPGGVVAFSTHMVDSAAVRLLGRRYPFFMEMHLVHFGRNTVRQLLHQAGFATPEIRPHRRVLRLGYLFDKVRHRLPLPVVSPLLRWLAASRWLADRHIGIGLLGLVNIFSKKRP